MKQILAFIHKRYGAKRSLLKGARAKFVTLFLTLLLPAAAQAETLRVAMLGDSLTQGYGLVAEDGLTSQLQIWLENKGLDVEIVNAGVSGDTTSGGLARAAWTLTPDVDALIVALGGNDVLRGVAPELAKTNLAGILDIARAQNLPILLVGTTVPSNYGATYQTNFENIYTELASEFETEHYLSLLAPLLDLGPMSELLQTHFQSDGLHPNPKGVAIIVEGFGPVVAEFLTKNTR